MKKKKGKKKYQFKKKFVKSIRNQTIREIICLSQKDVYGFLVGVPALKRTDKLFISSDNLHDFCLNRGIMINEIHFPDAYFNTAMLLLTMIKMTNSNSIRDGLIYPSLFCFRHYLELTMKDSLNYFERRKRVSEDVSNREHSLYKLWNSLTPYIENGEETKIIEKLISEIHNVDPKGEIFRYPYELSFDNCKKSPNFMQSGLNEVNNIKTIMCKIYRFMDGINSLAHDFKNN